uniref:Interleukin 18-A2 n=1 Tax=Andrias davidianus TaxID=141262 RepID=A0A6C0N4Q4_ANDDA|nr:interleukin 18-A2 [Andrias davidianus]
MSVSKFMVPQWLEDNLWFEEDTELDTDNWSRSSYSEPQMKILQNYLNLVLVAYPEQKHGCIARYESTLISPERGTFSLHYYRDNHPKHGMPVLFTVKVDNKKYLMYCATNGTVQFREEDAPKYIQGTTCEAVSTQGLKLQSMLSQNSKQNRIISPSEATSRPPSYKTFQIHSLKVPLLVLSSLRKHSEILCHENTVYSPL